jgi:hypothetical protein
MAGPIYSQHPAGGAVSDDWVTVAVPIAWAEANELKPGRPVRFNLDGGGYLPALWRKDRGKQSRFFDVRGDWTAGAMSGALEAATSYDIETFSAHANVSAIIDTAPTVQGGLWTLIDTETRYDLPQIKDRIYTFRHPTKALLLFVQRITWHGHPVETWHVSPYRYTLRDNGDSETIYVEFPGSPTTVLDRATENITEAAISNDDLYMTLGVDFGCTPVFSCQTYYGDGSNALEAIAGDGVPAALYDGWGDSVDERWFAFRVAPRTDATEQTALGDGTTWIGTSHSVFDDRPNTPNKATPQGAASQRFGASMSGAYLLASSAVAARDNQRLMAEDDTLRGYSYIDTDGSWLTAVDLESVWLGNGRIDLRHTPSSNWFYIQIEGPEFRQNSQWVDPIQTTAGGYGCQDSEHVDDLGTVTYLALYDDVWVFEKTGQQMAENQQMDAYIKTRSLGTAAGRIWGRPVFNLGLWWWLFYGTNLGNRLADTMSTRLDIAQEGWEGQYVDPSLPIRPFKSAFLRSWNTEFRAMAVYENGTCIKALCMTAFALPHRAKEALEMAWAICETALALAIPGTDGVHTHWIPFAWGIPGDGPGTPNFGEAPPAQAYVIGTEEHDDYVNGNMTSGWSWWTGMAPYLSGWISEALAAVDETSVSTAYEDEIAGLLEWLSVSPPAEVNTVKRRAEYYRMTTFPTTYAEAPMAAYPVDPPATGGGEPSEEEPSDPIEPPSGGGGSGGTGSGSPSLGIWERPTSSLPQPRLFMSDEVPAILIIGDSQVNGGTSGVDTRLSSAYASDADALRDLRLGRIVPSDNTTGATTAEDLDWFPWYDGRASDTYYTSSAGDATTITATPDPGWTTNEHAGKVVTVTNAGVGSPKLYLGFLSVTTIVSNTSDTLTVASWESNPGADHQFWIGEGRWRDYHPFQGYLHPSEVSLTEATISTRGGSAWAANGRGIGADAGIMREFLDHVWTTTPYFQVAKYANAFTTPDFANGESGASGLTTFLTGVNTAWSALTTDNALKWELIVLDMSQADVLDWVSNPENATTYQTAVEAAITEIRSQTDSDAVVILVNHEWSINHVTSPFGTLIANRAHRAIAADDANVRCITLQNERVRGATTSYYLESENRSGYASSVYYGPYAKKIRRAYQDVVAGTPVARSATVPVYLMLGDSLCAGQVNEAWAAVNDSPTLTWDARNSEQGIWNDQVGQVEPYDLGDNSNTSGTINGAGGPEFSLLVELEKRHPDGFFIIKRGVGSSTLVANGTAYTGSGTSGGRWSKSYSISEHYGDLGTLMSRVHQYCTVALGRQADLSGVVVLLGTNDQAVDGGGDLFAAELSTFVEDIRTDFSTRATGTDLPFVWVMPQLDTESGRDDESRTVRTALRNLDEDDPQFEAINIDDLERNDTDNIHLTQKGYVLLGQRIATALAGIAI